MVNRYSQLLKGTIVYIYETPLEMGDLVLHFSPETIWFDLTDIPEAEVGWVQGFDSKGRICITKPNTDELTEEEITLKRILKSKVDRDMYLDKLAQKKGFLDANECFSYIHSTNNIRALDARTLYAYRDYIDSAIKEEYTRTGLTVVVDRLDLDPIVW